MAFPFPEIKSITNLKFYLKTPKDLKVKRFVFSVKYKSFSFTCRETFPVCKTVVQFN